jgi:hypothetical protein
MAPIFTGSKFGFDRSAAAAAVGVSTVPTQFSYWTAGYTAGWNDTGTKTSQSGNGGDFLNSSLSGVGKVYWETEIITQNIYSLLGLYTGASQIGSGYTDDLYGYYYNSSSPVFLVANTSGHGDGTGTTWSVGDKLMWAYDSVSGKLYLGRNGVWYPQLPLSGGETTNPFTEAATKTIGSAAWYLKTGYNALLTVKILSQAESSYYTTSYVP